MIDVHLEVRPLRGLRRMELLLLLNLSGEVVLLNKATELGEMLYYAEPHAAFLVRL